MSDGDLTIDHYTLVNCIATGNSTQVWEVSEQGGPQTYAMKLLLPEAKKDLDQVRVLKAEAKAGKMFDHPNLMKVHFSVVNKQHGYIIMDFFRAANLKTQIHNDLTSLHVRIRKLVESTVLGLGYMHERGWVHRDVKPDNILFNKGGELRIVDYSLTSRAKRKHKEIQGTKSYIAPETLLKKATTAQTDMYSFGITLFLVLTGEFPITGTTPSELLKNHIRVEPMPPSKVNPNVTPEMDQLVLRLLAKKPENRPSSMAEVYTEFRNINVFHEDVETLQAQRQEAEKKEKLHGIDAASRLDSRADAERQALMREAGVDAPAGESQPKRKPLPTAKLKTKAAPTPAKESPAPAAAPAPAAPQPQQQPFPNPMMPPQPFPLQPGMMPPPAAPPQYPNPMMGQPYAPFPPGGMPMPQAPQGMPMGMPGAAPPPAVPQSPPQPPPGQPAAPPPASSANAAPAPPPQPPPAANPPAAPKQPAAAPQNEPVSEDLDFMDELPEVI